VSAQTIGEEGGIEAEDIFRTRGKFFVILCGCSGAGTFFGWGWGKI